MTNTEKLSDLLTRAADLARDMEGSDVGELRRQLEVFREDGVSARDARDAALRECDELRQRMEDEGRSRAELLEQLGALRERGDVAALERRLAEVEEQLETARELKNRAIEDSGRLRRELSGQRARAERAEKHVGDLAASIAILDEVLPAENRSGHEPLQVLQDAYDELETRRRALAELQRRYDERKGQVHKLAYGGESDEILDAISDLGEVVLEAYRTVEGPQGVVEGAIGVIKHLQARDLDLSEVDMILRDAVRSWDYEGSSISARARAVAQLLGQAQTRVGELDAELRREKGRRDDNPFVEELDSYRTALADLYRYVYSLPDHVMVPRTGQAARQAELIREKVDELRSALGGDDDGQGESLLDIEGLLELARRVGRFSPGERKR